MSTRFEPPSVGPEIRRRIGVWIGRASLSQQLGVQERKDSSRILLEQPLPGITRGQAVHDNGLLADLLERHGHNGIKGRRCALQHETDSLTALDNRLLFWRGLKVIAVQTGERLPAEF